MNNEIISHYLEFSAFTYPSNYLKNFAKSELNEIATILRGNLLHKNILKGRNSLSNFDQRYGDMTTLPWYRQSEDDYFQTASAILTEIHRRGGDLQDVLSPKDRVVITCRGMSIVVAAILKTKGVPARVRAAFTPYFKWMNGASIAHWINEYWNGQRWVAIDIDASLEDVDVNIFDLPKNDFETAAEVWNRLRTTKHNPKLYWNASGTYGLTAVLWQLFYDYHCLMNNEIPYIHLPEYVKSTEDNGYDLVDKLANLMLDIDGNFNELIKLWNSEKSLRLLCGGSL